MAGEELVKICGAKTRSGGECKNAPMANGRCRMHGGKSLSGWAHPRAKTGRYFKYMPPRLRERYEQAAADPELLALNQEIALIDARSQDVLSRVDTGESGRLMKEIKDTYHRLIEAKNRGDPSEFGVELNRLGKLIDVGVADWYAWSELMSLFEQRRRLVESERRRLVDLQQMITAEQAYMLIGRLGAIVKEYVDDQKILAAISNDLRDLVLRKGYEEEE
jgi:hypothetical protein